MILSCLKIITASVICYLSILNVILFPEVDASPHLLPWALGIDWEIKIADTSPRNEHHSIPKGEFMLTLRDRVRSSVMTQQPQWSCFSSAWKGVVVARLSASWMTLMWGALGWKDCVSYLASEFVSVYLEELEHVNGEREVPGGLVKPLPP